ncbi:MAG: hypothetical protein IJ873_02875 [Lachnospiraceae bacterium]|nr:hypothetical protein [Lachnospiraceae bacterium]
MNRKKLYPVFSIAALIIFFIWGWIEGSFEHSWIIFLAVPVAIAIVNAMDGKDDKKGGEKGADKKE